MSQEPSKFTGTASLLGHDVRFINGQGELSYPVFCELKVAVEVLQEKLKQAEHSLRVTSNNSSQSPAHDSPKARAERGQTSRDRLKKKGKGKKKRKKGGQKGHPGHGLLARLFPKKVVHLYDARCEACPHCQSCASLKPQRTRSCLDAQFIVTFTQYRNFAGTCPMTGEVHQGIYPPGVLHNFQYGTNIKAAAIALVLQGVMSRERVHQFLGSLLQVPISAGTIDNWFQEFAEDPLLKLAMERLDSDLLAAPFNGFDETYMWVNGILSFGHIACTPEITRVHFSRSKGKKGMEEGDYIQFYDGIALHDRNNTYFLFKFKHHVLCVAHLLRELEGVYEDDPKQTWAKRLSLLLKRYIEKRNLAIEAGQLRFYAPTLKSLRRDFTRLLREGDKQAPPLAKKEAGKKGKPKNDRGRNALEHLKKCIEYYLLPYTDFRLPVTNNVSEGGFRMIKVREKIGPCRTERGATNFCRAFSYISTAGKRGVSAVDAIRLALEGTPEKALWPKGEPPPLPQKEARDGTG